MLILVSSTLSTCKQVRNKRLFIHQDQDSLVYVEGREESAMLYRSLWPSTDPQTALSGSEPCPLPAANSGKNLLQGL